MAFFFHFGLLLGCDKDYVSPTIPMESPNRREIISVGFTVASLDSLSELFDSFADNMFALSKT